VKLAKAYAALLDEEKKQVRKFLRADAFSRRPEQIQESLDKIANRNIRQMLEGYVAYANRYRVFFRIKNTNPLEFEVRAWPYLGSTFHATVAEDHLEPLNIDFVPEDDDSLAEYFRTDNQPPPAIKVLVDAGKATYFRIDEENDFSMLRQLEDVT
jgi:hypothetical protein